jgi:hypothetical protein
MTRKEIFERSQAYRARRAEMLAEREAQRREAAEVRRQREQKFRESLPTPEEIASRCEAIQAGWTEYERYSRWLMAHTVDGISGVERPGVDLLVVRVRELSAA